jgi:hypothetical protein
VVVAQLPQGLDRFQVPEKVLQCRLNYVGFLVATWEDELLLHQRFPQAPAWGQAGSHRWGIVTYTTKVQVEGMAVASNLALDSTKKEGASKTVDGLVEGKQPRRPNTRLMGPEWRV